MSATSEPQQVPTDIENTNADQSFDTSNAIQKLIDELEEGDIFFMADEIVASIARAQDQREKELAELDRTNDELRQELEHKKEHLRAMTKINDAKVALIDINSAIADYEFSPIDKSQDLLEAVRTRNSELYNLKLDITQENSDLRDSLSSLIQKRAKLQNELNDLTEKLENPEPKQNIDPEKLKEYDLALLKINFYRNLGIRIEPFKKPESASESASESATGAVNPGAFLTQDSENALDFTDDPEQVVIVQGSDGQVKNMLVGLSCPEESVSRFIWENID
ncbi:hypothetical protein KGF57_004542 [Candida theae]|uniref:Kinetochore protein Spc24 n=1 Tax=Candida theae TaxID=1198502 RepID=A0AAD5FWT6_9ASCO|nr:uncharacterized protein KGF57_004542 [Candida theae]KAI5950032.1 hypothetical protein KGF57_004542 [Candida theae]